MKNKLFNKHILKYLIATSLISVCGIFAVTVLANASQKPKTEVANVKVVGSEILATGSIDSQSKATLNFQIGGKLVYLPFKEGDAVYQGQTIAQLDSSDLQKKLASTLATYRSVRDTFDQTQQNSQTGVLQGQQQYGIDVQNKVGIKGQIEVDVINDMVKRILDQNQNNLDISVINVELANSALQLSTLASPINGIILRQDVTTSGVNITPATSFVVVDPSNLVFSANVRQQDIDFINVGNSAKITVDGKERKVISGTVDKIYPQKTVTSNGESVYRVDIKMENASGVILGQSGTVLIKSNFSEKVMLVPSWTVLADNYIWVLENNKPVLKQVTLGNKTNENTEIMSGISENDKVITNPQSVISGLYKIL